MKREILAAALALALHGALLAPLLLRPRPPIEVELLSPGATGEAAPAIDPAPAPPPGVALVRLAPKARRLPARQPSRIEQVSHPAPAPAYPAVQVRQDPDELARAIAERIARSARKACGTACRGSDPESARR